MCPNECPGLDETHSEEFEALYLKYEAAKERVVKRLKHVSFGKKY